jgi:putative flippase GtrA
MAAPRAPAGRRTNAARVGRFALTGILAGLVQLGALSLLIHNGWQSLLANAVAFLLSAQLNFVLSHLFTWRDRQIGRRLWRRWLAFHGSIAAMAALNMAVFVALRPLLPALLASAAGICAAALGNYLIGDHVVFRAHPQQLPVARIVARPIRVTEQSA